MSGDFDFKRFTVAQSDCAMKIGTDGVLIGAWVRLTGNEGRILDIGTGSGLIALIMAQRSERWNAEITGVEIDAPSAAQAAQNAAATPWADRIAVHNADIRTFTDQPFDLIVSNPPFFDRSLRSPFVRRTTARHTEQLSFDELCSAAARLLAPEGRFALIIPMLNLPTVIAKAAAAGLFCSRITEVATRSDAAPKRAMAEFSFRSQPTERTRLAILDQYEFTDEYRELTRDFYLKF